MRASSIPKLYINASFLCTKESYGIVRYGLAMCVGLKEALAERVEFLVPRGWDYSEEAQKLGLTVMGRTTNRAVWEQIDLPLFLLRKGAPLLINFSNTGPFLYPNQIYTIYDLFFKTSNNFIKNNRQFYSSSYIYYANVSYAILLKVAKRIITISQYTKNEVCRSYKLNPDKVDVVYPCLEERFLESSGNSLNKYGKYVVGVSSIRPNKNFSGLITGFIKAKLPKEVSLVIVGGGESLVKNYTISEQLNGQSNIRFTGYITDEELIHIYKNALFLVYPSFFEGFGIPPTEAMACGCPAILSDVTSLPEVGGDAAIYVNPYDTDAIGEAIRNLYYNDTLRAELVKKGYERIRLFEKKTSIQNLLHTIERVAK